MCQEISDRRRKMHQGEVERMSENDYLKFHAEDKR